MLSLTVVAASTAQAFPSGNPSLEPSFSSTTSLTTVIKATSPLLKVPMLSFQVIGIPSSSINHPWTVYFVALSLSTLPISTLFGFPSLILLLPVKIRGPTHSSRRIALISTSPVQNVLPMILHSTSILPPQSSLSMVAQTPSPITFAAASMIHHLPLAGRCG